MLMIYFNLILSKVSTDYIWHYIGISLLYLSVLWSLKMSALYCFHSYGNIFNYLCNLKSSVQHPCGMCDWQRSKLHFNKCQLGDWQRSRLHFNVNWETGKCQCYTLMSIGRLAKANVTL